MQIMREKLQCYLLLNSKVYISGFTHWKCSLYFQENFGASGVALSLKARATKYEDLSSVTGTHVVEGQNPLP